MFIAISNFPMGKAIMDYLDATEIELDEDSIFHLDNILLERKLKDRIIALNHLDKEAIKNLNYYSSAILTDDLKKIQHWDSVSVDLSIHCYLEMDKETWSGVVAGDKRYLEAMQSAINTAQKLL
ncbi:MAG: hypothetical protein OQJ97_16090 [Rhodospirillales bacterium]|nr:hypothetical protein [Rhodospirillales bacterium]